MTALFLLLLVSDMSSFISAAHQYLGFVYLFVFFAVPDSFQPNILAMIIAVKHLHANETKTHTMEWVSLSLSSCVAVVIQLPYCNIFFNRAHMLERGIIEFPD